MNRTTACLAPLVVLLSGSAALAQLMVPPTSQPTTAPEFVLAPEPPPPAPQPPRAVANPARARPVQEPLPVLEYKRLAEVDPATGAFKSLDKPAEWMAVERNPMLTPEDFEKFKPAMERRKEAYENLVVTNFELLDQLDRGLLTKADPSMKEEFGGIVRATKPLMTPNAPSALAGDLERLGLVTNVQSRFSQKIANEYSADLIAGPEKVAKGEKGDPGQSMVAIYKQRLEEPIYVYHQMQIEASQHLPYLIQEVYVPQDLIDRLMTYAARITPTTSDADRITIMREMEATLNIDQRKGFYHALRFLRPKIAEMKAAAPTAK